MEMEVSALDGKGEKLSTLKREKEEEEEERRKRFFDRLSFF